MSPINAKHSFVFKTRLSLVEMTGYTAFTLHELREHMKNVPESSIYYHTHHFIRRRQLSSPDPSNDFAYWASEALQEELSGERLAAIDVVRFNTIQSLREAIVSVLDRCLSESVKERKAAPGMEFRFMKCLLFTLPISIVAHDLKGFLEGVRSVSGDSLYNHMFEGRLRPPLGENDFSSWLKNDLGETDLANKIEQLDPYLYTIEGLRKRIVALIEKRMAEDHGETR